MLRRKNMSPLDVAREDEVATRFGQSLKAETLGSVTSNTSEYSNILANFKAFTGESQCDKWLEKIIQGIQFVCTPMENAQTDDNEKGRSNCTNHASEGKCLKAAIECQLREESKCK